jgi:hypothetical protein
VLAKELIVLNEAKTPPFEIEDTSKINEELRLKYRYLDLRSSRMLKNIELRDRVIGFFRDYLHNLDVLKSVDHIIDIGPDGGIGGGKIIATGTPEEVAKSKDSYTGEYLEKMLAKGKNK